MDPRAQRTKSLLLAALGQLLTTKNFDQLTVTGICQTANVSRKAFYTYYDDKYELIDAFSNQQLEQLDQASHHNTELSAVERLTIWVTYLEQRRTLFAKLLTSDASYSFRRKFGDYLLTGLSHHEKGSIDRVTLTFLATGFLGVIEGYITGQFAGSPQSIAKKLDALSRDQIKLT